MENIIIYIVMTSVKARLPSWYEELQEAKAIQNHFSSIYYLYPYPGLIRCGFPSSLQHEAGAQVEAQWELSSCVPLDRLFNFDFHPLFSIAHRDNTHSHWQRSCEHCIGCQVPPHPHQGFLLSSLLTWVFKLRSWDVRYTGAEVPYLLLVWCLQDSFFRIQETSWIESQFRPWLSSPSCHLGPQGVPSFNSFLWRAEVELTDKAMDSKAMVYRSQNAPIIHSNNTEMKMAPENAESASRHHPYYAKCHSGSFPENTGIQVPRGSLHQQIRRGRNISIRQDQWPCWLAWI